MHSTCTFSPKQQISESHTEIYTFYAYFESSGMIACVCNIELLPTGTYHAVVQLVPTIPASWFLSLLSQDLWWKFSFFMEEKGKGKYVADLSPDPSSSYLKLEVIPLFALPPLLPFLFSLSQFILPTFLSAYHVLKVHYSQQRAQKHAPSSKLLACKTTRIHPSYSVFIHRTLGSIYWVNKHKQHAKYLELITDACMRGHHLY